MAAWSFDALAGACLEGDGRVVRLERRAAALLLVLATVGTLSRSRAAGLVWPASPEPTARNNLSQALRRLRRAVGRDLVLGDGHLTLGDVRVELWTAVGDVRLDALGAAPLLAAHEYADVPELHDWLESERRRLLERHVAALHERAERAVATGGGRLAVEAFERIVALEPYDEVAHRGVIRARRALGDRAGAIRAAGRVLQLIAALGGEPDPATTALVGALRPALAAPASVAARGGERSPTLRHRHLRRLRRPRRPRARP